MVITMTHLPITFVILIVDDNHMTAHTLVEPVKLKNSMDLPVTVIAVQNFGIKLFM